MRIWLLPALLLFAACAGSTITGTAAHELVSKQGALLVDVRTVDEFDSGHVEGAINLPVQELGSRLAALPKKDQDIVVYCHSGSRSARAAELLKQAGYTRVHDLGGMSNWR